MMSDVMQSIVSFNAALRTAAEQAIACYPGEQARINRGLVIALNGGVTFDAQGLAHVQSSNDPEIQYVVNGHCQCRDADTHAPEGRCKHRWAKTLVHKAQTLLVTTNLPRKAYYATLNDVHGGLYQQPDGTIVFQADASDALTVIDPKGFPPGLVVHGEILMSTAQAAEDLRKARVARKAL